MFIWVAGTFWVKPKHTMSPYKTPFFILHVLCSYLYRSYLIYFNLSQKNVVVPNLLKDSTIIIVFKKANSKTIEKYKPITIIINFSKVLEISWYQPIFSCIKNVIYLHSFMKPLVTYSSFPNSFPLQLIIIHKLTFYILICPKVSIS